jgi:mono/diheme cytochrome c family protein
LTTERLRLLGVLALLAATACRQDMHDQPKYPPLRPSRFFADGRSARPRIQDTVARDPQNAEDAAVGENAALPVPLTAALLARGQQRYDIYCSVCHDRVGSGGGMIVERGFKRPPSFHIDRLRHAADGYFYLAITNGFGVMPSYAASIFPADRWAIVAYVRALQLSQNATLADVPPAERSHLGTGE